MQLIIKPKSSRGRTFQAELLASVHTNRLWDTANVTAFRPVYLSFVETHETMRAFVANLRLKREAHFVGSGARSDSKLELLKSAPYQFRQQRRADGLTVCEVFLPEVVALDPGRIDPSVVQGLVMVPSWWADRQLAYFSNFPAEERREMAAATWFAAFIDNRIDIPLYRDPLYFLQLYRNARSNHRHFQDTSKCGYWVGDPTAYPTATPPGFDVVAQFRAPASEVEGLIYQTMRDFCRGKTRLSSPRGLLSNA